MERRNDLIKQMTIKNLSPILVIRIDPKEMADIETQAKQHTQEWYSQDKRKHVADSAWRIRGDLSERAFEHYLIQQNILHAHAKDYARRGDAKPDFVVMKNEEIITIGIKSGRHRDMAKSPSPTFPYEIKPEHKIANYILGVSVLSSEGGSNIAFWGILDKSQIMDAYQSLTMQEGTLGKQNRFVRIPLGRFCQGQERFEQLIASLERGYKEAIER